MAQIVSKFISDDAITSAKIAADAVNSSEIAADAVTASELADNAVDANAIASNAVTTAKINADAVTDTKIRLSNNAYMRARNAANSADIDIIKVNASDVIEFPTFPQKSGTPSNANDLANKSYVDTAVSGSVQVAKQAVVVVSTSNLTLSGEQTIDGVLTSASRVLVAGQTTAANNGIYVTAAGAWSRATDADSSAEVLPGMLVYVASGTNYGESIWALDTLGSITLGSTSLSFKKQTPLFKQESKTLSGGDITNQYVDAAFTALSGSFKLFISGLYMVPGVDFTLSVVSGVTRITFAGSLATGGASELVAGDVLLLDYSY
jgi:uncharacterized cupin superfamily protein